MRTQTVFIGRLGALGVALGLGIAIANSPGIALADGTAPGSPSAASTAASGSANTPPAPKRKPDKKPVAPSQQSPTGRGAADFEPKKPLGHAAPAVTTKPRQATMTSAAPVKTGGPPASAKTTVVATAPTIAEPSPASTGPATTPIGFVTGLLSTLGLDPQATNGPVAPAAPPTLWTLLGWVRREVGQVLDPASAGTGVTTTSTALVAPTTAPAVPSPLGTQQQLAGESLAAQTANTLPVQLMKLVLQLSFLGSADQLFAGVGGPDQANLDQLGAAVNEYAMGAAFQQQILDSNAPTVVMQVAPPHTWYGLDVPGSRILYDNPDTIYRFMGVNAASTYVISGRFAGPVPADTTFSVLTGLSGNTAQVLSGRDLQINPDGTFTITVGAAPAAPGEKNYLQLPSDATLIAARNTLSDWNTQQPMSLSIERVSGPPDSLFSQLGGFAIPFIGPLVVSNPLLTTLVSLIPPLPYVPPILRGAVTAVIMALGIQREAQYMAVATTDPQTGQRIAPNELKAPAKNAEFLATQLQSAGYFQLADDQALVVTIDPGNAGYFVVPVTNDWTITDNYWDQQTSLNNSQAVRNADGTYTIVISPTDPGVTNWVSTGGLNQGTISIRFQDLDPNSTAVPTVTSEVVNIDQLPADIPRITPADRALQLAARKAGYDNRFAPFPQP